MKILDKYLIKRFTIPFLATFLVVLFVLIILTIWQKLDDLSGRGLSASVIFKFLWYTTLAVVPNALSIGILLSSIMAMGNLSENYEYAAIKSAGVSLFRLIKPLVISMIILSGLNFLFLNYVFPYASFEGTNLSLNMKKKQPAMALIAGSFNTDIPGYTIKFEKKYGKKNNLLKDVIIYDLTEKKYNNVVITSKYGEIKSTPNSKYMTLILKNGNYYKDVIPKRAKSIKKDNMPFIKSHFDEYQINFDISKMDDISTDKKYDQERKMLSLGQIKEKVKKDKEPLKKSLTRNKIRFYNATKANKLKKNTTKIKISNDILENFKINNKLRILQRAKANITSTLRTMKDSDTSYKKKVLKIKRYQVEYHNRIATSLAVLVLFLIGAPLGSIIRKGGFGVPLITAVVIYVTYHFIGVFTRGMADTGELPPWLGSWFSTIIMFPFGIYLSFRAIKDKGVFNLDIVMNPIKRIIKKFTKKKALS